jgi:hypothetical protein
MCRAGMIMRVIVRMLPLWLLICIYQYTLWEYVHVPGWNIHCIYIYTIRTCRSITFLIS